MALIVVQISINYDMFISIIFVNNIFYWNHSLLTLAARGFSLSERRNRLRDSLFHRSRREKISGIQGTVSCFSLKYCCYNVGYKQLYIRHLM